MRRNPELESSLRKLPGVIAASAIAHADHAHALTRVHVIASRGADARQLTAQIAHHARHDLGIDLDHRIVNVTVSALADGETTAGPRDPGLLSVLA